MIPQLPPRRVLTSILFILVAGYAGVLLVLYLGQTRLLYLPTPGLDATPDDIGLPYEEVRLRTGDGVRIAAWWIPPPPGGRGTVLFFHGNAGNISHRLHSLRTFHELGVGVLIVSYRGYGPSEGRPSERGTYRDARAAWEHLVAERGIPPSEIVLFGRSLGGAVATNLAADVTAGGLIVESTFTSVPDLASELFPWVPARLIARLRYDARQRMKEVESPVLVIHSRNDEIIPFRHGKALYAAAGRPKRFLEIRGSHNEGFVVSDREYRRGLAEFFSSVGIGSEPGD